MNKIKEFFSAEIIIPSIKIKAENLFLLPFLFYFAWELFWFSKVGLAFVKWHTHFMSLIFLWYLVVLLLKLINNEGIKQKLVLSWSSIMFSLFIIELIFSLIGINKTYMESRLGYYHSIEANSQKDVVAKRVYSRPINEFYTASSPEFSFNRTSNNYGFNDFNFKMKSKKTLIQIYGDSFTEGDGAVFDSSYPAVLRNLLHDSIEIQNYGLSGNDPGFYIDQINKVGRNFNPDLLIMTYSKWDLTFDFFSRGGLNRNKYYRKGPWWEFIYAISYTSRIFFSAAGYSYTNFFLNKEEYNNDLKKLELKWNEVFSEIFKIAQQNNLKILLVKLPDKSEIKNGTYYYNFTFFEKKFNNLSFVKYYDLLPYYVDSIGMKNEKETAKYFWVQDGHHNAKGYHAMAKGVYNGLKTNYPEIFE